MQNNPILQKGDSCFIVSPSYCASKIEIEKGIAVLRIAGLEVESGSSIFYSWGSFAGSDDERLSDLQNALDSESCKVIFCIRGGYGLSRVYHRLDWTKFLKNPKWVIGFSDVTFLHLKIQKLGFPSIHGLMLARFADRSHLESFDKLFSLLLNSAPRLEYDVLGPMEFQSEIVKGLLTGGNLSIISNSMGTDLEPDFSNCILFLEDVGEAFYRIDRMIHQIKYSKTSRFISAIVLGQFTDCPLANFPLSLIEIFTNTFPEIPIFYGLECGHGIPNFPIFLGIETTIKKTKNGYLLSQNPERTSLNF